MNKSSLTFLTSLLGSSTCLCCSCETQTEGSRETLGSILYGSCRRMLTWTLVTSHFITRLNLTNTHTEEPTHYSVTMETRKQRDGGGLSQQPNQKHRGEEGWGHSNGHKGPAGGWEGVQMSEIVFCTQTTYTTVCVPAFLSLCH